MALLPASNDGPGLAKLSRAELVRASPSSAAFALDSPSKVALDLPKLSGYTELRRNELFL